MLHIKENPVGIDVPIQELQVAVHDLLIKKWKLQDGMYHAYGRAYRNQVREGNGYIPEVFAGGIDYADPMLDDTKTATSFFGTSAKTSIKGDMGISDVHMIFCLNLNDIKSLTHRGDEEAHFDILRALDIATISTLKVSSTEQGMDAVFREYSGYRAQKGMKFGDMHPYHCFRINFPLNYYNNC